MMSYGVHANSSKIIKMNAVVNKEGAKLKTGEDDNWYYRRKANIGKN